MVVAFSVCIVCVCVCVCVAVLCVFLSRCVHTGRFQIVFPLRLQDSIVLGTCGLERSFRPAPRRLISLSRRFFGGCPLSGSAKIYEAAARKKKIPRVASERRRCATRIESKKNNRPQVPVVGKDPASALWASPDGRNRFRA